MSPGVYVLGFLMYVALSFVSIYFNAAVIGTAMKRLKGEPAIDQGRARAGAPAHRQDLRVGHHHRHRGHDPPHPAGALGPDRADPARHHRHRLDGADVLRRARPALRGASVWATPSSDPARSSASAGVSSSSGTRRSGSAIFLVAIPIVIVGGLITAAAPVVGDPAAGRRDRRAHGDRRGLHRCLQRRPLPLRDHRRELRRVHRGGHVRVLPSSRTRRAVPPFTPGGFSGRRLRWGGAANPHRPGRARRPPGPPRSRPGTAPDPHRRPRRLIGSARTSSSRRGENHGQDLYEIGELPRRRGAGADARAAGASRTLRRSCAPPSRTRSSTSPHSARTTRS